jgi:2,3-bisphosphoglycerate-dependent phosphoglycerate mutase
MTQLVMIRHGKSQWNLENRFAGFQDIPLTPAGEDEARQAGEKIKAAGLKFDHVFTSTLQRAYHTAELVLETLGLQGVPTTKADELRERDYGDLVGLNKEETAVKYGKELVHLWRRSYDVPPPGGESLADVVARVTPYYQQHIAPELAAGKSIFIAAHGNSLRATLIVLGLNTPEDIIGTEIPTGSPMVVEFQAGVPVGYRYL